MTEKIKISEHSATDHTELLGLLLKLHRSYFAENAPKPYQELRQEKGIRNSYEKYLDSIERNKGGDWKIFVAKNEAGVIAGFIIGSITQDDSLVLGKIGKLEDWYVEPELRKQNIGLDLYYKLEAWFKERGCKQVSSGTWDGNDVSIMAHKKVGFFISEISFSKKI